MPIGSTGRHCSRSGPCSSQYRWPGTSARPGSRSRRRRRPRRCSSASAAARALEAGWKYLILTSLGLGVALLGILVLGRAAGGGGLGGLDLARTAARLADAKTTRRRLRAAARWTRGQDRLGARAQLAARRPLRGARAGLARSSRPRSCRRCCSSPGARSRRSLRRSEANGRRRARRLRARLARRRCAVPLAPAGLEATARLLEPRAHGRDRARDRLRWPARARRRRHPHRRARARQGARLLRGDAAPRATTRAPLDTRSQGSARRSPRSAPPSASRSEHSPACLPHRCLSARS